jgi:hypothetical protein
MYETSCFIFHFVFLLFCTKLFRIVPVCFHLHAILMPTELSPIFRELLEILLDLQKSVFVSFLFTVELSYSMAKLRFLI